MKKYKKRLKEFYCLPDEMIVRGKSNYMVCGISGRHYVIYKKKSRWFHSFMPLHNHGESSLLGCLKSIKWIESFGYKHMAKACEIIARSSCPMSLYGECPKGTCVVKNGEVDPGTRWQCLMDWFLDGNGGFYKGPIG